MKHWPPRRLGYFLEMQENQELPQGWTWTNFTQLAAKEPHALKAGPFGSALKKEYYVPTGYKVYGQEQVIRQDASYGDYFIDETRYETLISCKVKPGDILISLVGTIGKVLILPDNILPGIINPRLVKLSLDKQAVESKFTKLYLESPDVKSLFSTVSHGGTMDILNLSKLRELKIPLPPLPEQRRIVAKLEELFSRWEAGVAALRHTQAQLKRYRQAVLHAAVTGELTRTWREAHPAPAESGAALLARIRQERRTQWEAAQLAKRGGQLPLGDTWKKKYEEPADLDTSELPELPAGWVWAGGELVADFVDPQPSHRTPPEFENGVAYIGMGDVGKGNHINFDQSRKVHPDVFKEHADRYKLKLGDFFFGKIGTIGNPVKLPEPFNYTLSANIILVQPHVSIAQGYLYWYMSGPFISGHFKKNSKATTQAAFGIQKARVLPVPLPSLAEQAEIVAEVERRLSVLDELEHTLRAELTRAERLRQSILHRAFTGRLVPQDPTNEPAAALLARLQAEVPAGAAAKAKRGPKAGAQLGMTF